MRKEPAAVAPWNQQPLPLLGAQRVNASDAQRPASPPARDAVVVPRGPLAPVPRHGRGVAAAPPFPLVGVVAAALRASAAHRAVGAALQQPLGTLRPAPPALDCGLAVSGYRGNGLSDHSCHRRRCHSHCWG